MANQTWKFDTTHSTIGFTVKHMVFAKVRGIFGEWSGEFRFAPEHGGQNYVRAEIDIASVNTNNEQRDGHLRSADFFDAETHPKMTFESSTWTARDGGFDVVGDLTICGTTKPVTVRVQQHGTGVDPWGNTRIGLGATATINRQDFGLVWNQALEAGGVLVGDEVKIEIEVQAIAAEVADEAAAE